jgi:hypothetical protein
VDSFVPVEVTHRLAFVELDPEQEEDAVQQLESEVVPRDAVDSREQDHDWPLRVEVPLLKLVVPLQPVAMLPESWDS